jgi:hypothetical protein
MIVSMRDLDIRKAFREYLAEVHRNEKGTLVVEEMGICQGQTRIDVAVVNGSLNGYEIKSDRDTLERLPKQVELYSKTLDHAWILVGSRYALDVRHHIPDWWGLMLAIPTATASRIAFEVQQSAQLNPNIDPFALCQLLWRDEALAILEQRGMARGVRSKPRRYSWQRLADNLELDELKQVVRQTLKAREQWTTAEPLTSGDD